MTPRAALPALLLAALLLPLPAARAELPPPAGPHAGELGCKDCHPAADPAAAIADCDVCHDASRNIHPIGMVPQVKIPEGMALSADGKLLCRTCHTIHEKQPDRYLLNDAAGSEKLGRAAYCAACHGLQNVRTNPHSARQGDSRCVFCHKSPPAYGQDAHPTLRTAVIRLCDFCHDKVGLNHPRNIDPEISLPEGLPMGADGQWDCATCHDPHGTVTTTQHIRPLFAKHMERGRQENPHKPDYFACKACHTESDTKSIRVPGGNLRYRGDLNILCISCHVTDKGHHPTGIGIPAAMQARYEKSAFKVPLDEGGRITCYSCHDNQCETGENRMRIRHYDVATYTTDLCWACHDREEYAKTSPHVKDEAACLRCHEHRPVPGISMELMAVPVMVCLHCHEVKPHPIGKSHLASPSRSIKVDPSLPLSKAGEVTCVTCHEPHDEGRGFPDRLRAEPKAMCAMCHWKS
jgi:hypothetical protein